MEKLKEGNQRYADGKLTHPDQSLERRTEVAGGQHPFAVIVGCADSRLSHEIVFDQGLGDLFVVRVAGEVVDNSALGSIEYGVEHLHASLIVVLGHERCGAVDAAIDAVEKNTVYPKHIDALVDPIKPAYVKGQNHEETLELSVKKNAKLVAGKLTEDPSATEKSIIKKLVEEKKVTIVTGYYDLDTGKVIFD